MRPLPIAFSAVCLANGVFLASCGKSEDADVEKGLSTVAATRSAHPHYPLTVLQDLGNDGPPVGIAVDAYGFYVHASAKSNPHLNALSDVEATAKVEGTLERSLQAIVTAEAGTPPPKPPLPSNPDWKNALHPAQGSYTIVCSVGSKKRTFEFAGTGQGGADAAQLIAKIKPELLRDAAPVVADGRKAENDSLAASAPPAGFTFCTDELLKLQQGNRGVEPHLIGTPLLLTPIDKTLSLKGAAVAIRKMVDRTGKIQPAPEVAHVVVQGPEFNATYPVTVKSGPDQEKGLKAALDGFGAEIDQLNKKAP